MMVATPSKGSGPRQGVPWPGLQAAARWLLVAANGSTQIEALVKDKGARARLQEFQRGKQAGVCTWHGCFPRSKLPELDGMQSMSTRQLCVRACNEPDDSWDQLSRGMQKRPQTMRTPNCNACLCSKSSNPPCRGNISSSSPSDASITCKRSGWTSHGPKHSAICICCFLNAPVSSLLPDPQTRPCLSLHLVGDVLLGKHQHLMARDWVVYRSRLDAVPAQLVAGKAAMFGTGEGSAAAGFKHAASWLMSWCLTLRAL
ncbi:hypothetical protein HaLaN_02189 [Haematococcus lacustris]|uniref:Uncharacterized protein n=1 Tax=Haematococcus lacustris TaxID=44745 RepID=A0A699YB53_HAELA|nr:hypothetical protein HaLaN_02189 [Haematococcus lacustris]